MVEAMAFASPDGVQLGADRAASNEYDGEIGNGSKVMDDFAGQRCDESPAGADDARQEGATSEPIGLPTSRMAKVRKQKRILQPVPSMSPGAQVEPQSREVGNGWKAFVSKIFFACAILQIPCPHHRDRDPLRAKPEPDPSDLQQCLRRAL